eukprot:scaffold69_cov198-Alexandrium_tamarense.AAC.34
MLMLHSFNTGDSSWDKSISIALDIYSPSERREYLVQRGNKCHPSNHLNGASFNGAAAASGGGTNMEEEDHSFLQWYDILSRYDSLVAASKSPSSSSTTTTSAISSQELERLSIELWKYCLLYNGDGHVYLDYEGGVLLRPLKEMMGENLEENVGVVAVDGGVSTSGGDVGGEGGEKDGTKANNNSNSGRYIHESFLAISPYSPATSELGAMIRLVLETSDEMLAHSPLLLPRELHRLIVGRHSQALNTGSSDSDGGAAKGSGDIENGATWTLWRNNCIDIADQTSVSTAVVGAGGGSTDEESGVVAGGAAYSSFYAYPSSSSTFSGISSPDAYARRTAVRCPLSEGGYCCLAFSSEQSEMPVMALRHPVGGWSVSASKGSISSSPLVGEMPYKLNLIGDADGGAKRDASTNNGQPLKLGGVPESDLPYISIVRLIQNNTDEAPYTSDSSSFPSGHISSHPADTPNFFDILFENDCLPYRKECHRCLKDVSNETPDEDDNEAASTDTTTTPVFGKHMMQNACSKCKSECPCYCDILCKVRPPPKKVTRTYAVHPPRYKKEVGRLVPKIIHQTWFEPVTRDKYPNMSRLIESWKKSGWEYYFYDDDTAGEFLSTHFPPEVREAYESITPGAFKADLFRYCVLLIRGGVYADMDVLLETNLDDAIANDIGFMTPIDEPGTDVGHRSCLWNGLIASAPGHPFLARTIEIVVNNIRNRFTAVDYDDMLCPNPILSVSHTVDTLFTCGPCILGAGINNIIGRHMQNEFEIGDVDIWQNERTEMAKKNPGNDNSVAVQPDDPRLLIPGRTVILEQNKNDMGAHRFTWADRHLIIAATDMPDYDDRPPSKEHYSKTHEKAGIYGMRKLYTDSKRANEEIRIVVEKL